MFVKVKSQNFIDRVTFEVDQPSKTLFRAVLRDDKGSVCSALETQVEREHQVFDWNGLNDLPYGVYSFEISQGSEETKMRLVKRI
jgi:hypothetical protein